MTDLPITPLLPRLAATLADHCQVILAAPPGSGKTTGVPPALLAAPWLRDKKIIILEPRRLAARAAAGRMAELAGEAVGETVGYRIRFEQRVSARTRIEVVTEGILGRMLQADPELADVGLVIFDEFHERSLHADLALALAIDVQKGLRDDLRILIMSATLDMAGLAALLPEAAQLAGEGRAFPVEIRYLDRDQDDDPVRIAAGGVARALAEQPGDLLVFLPGGGEIRRLAALLAAAGDPDLRVHPLYGDLPRAAQNAAIRPDPAGHRRVVLATSIAETSLTLDGVTTVVDTGWTRRPRLDPNSGLSGLATVRVSKAAADQRAGRAGRTGPGVCYRLWSRHVQQGLVEHLAPEIAEADLAPLALQLAHWGVADAEALTWLDPPPRPALARARALLADLDALDHQGRITALGRQMAALPLHPRLAHMLLAADAGQNPLACRLAAILAERDPLKGGGRSVDIEERLRLLQVFEAEGSEAVRARNGDPDLCRRLLQAATQWRRLLPRAATAAPPLSPGALLSLAYPDRIGQRRGASTATFLLANGRAARLPPHEPLAASPLLVAPQLDLGATEARIFLAASLSVPELRELHGHRIVRQETVTWEPRQEAVRACRQERLGALVLAETALAHPDREQIRAALLAGIGELGLACLPWDKPARELQARIASLRAWQPETTWPDVSDQALLATLAEWLGPYLDGISRREQLRSLDLAAILRDRLPWPLPQRLDDDAPTHLAVPSGSRIRLQYQPDGGPPVLAVRLQELFGLADTPTVCGGRIEVVLHLLSPAQRPIQVTRDLRGFWDHTYPEVKKELAGRYPKHHWPDDPWSAQATARAKARRR